MEEGLSRQPTFARYLIFLHEKTYIHLFSFGLIFPGFFAKQFPHHRKPSGQRQFFLRARFGAGYCWHPAIRLSKVRCGNLAQSQLFSQRTGRWRPIRHVQQFQLVESECFLLRCRYRPLLHPQANQQVRAGWWLLVRPDWRRDYLSGL